MRTPTKELSDRQKQIFALMTAGKTDKEIALALHESPDYVGLQIYRMHKKVGHIQRPKPMLTNAEQAVVSELAKGKTLLQASHSLGIAQGTVSSLAARAYKKYGVNCRADLFNMIGRGVEYSIARVTRE